MTDERLNVVLSSLFYAEKMVGGCITGGASLEALNTWHRLADIKDGVESEPITEGELRELEARNLTYEDRGTWRGILGRLGDQPMPFGLASSIPDEADSAV